MRLKRLEICGFKSFGKKANFEFPSAITAIVGPNGSGKSNVAEAIRFVLGEQSMKSMRGKRGEDLIFNGSQQAGRASRANVTIVFDNTKREFPIDFDEVSIAREVYRDGTNQYFLNGSQVRLKDIFELLASVHIGASGHHMISQGEADRILNANPKERREMIEDALGLKLYLYKRAESERRLQKTEENMKEAEMLRKEIAPHLRFLKKQVEKVEEARELRERITGLYREYLKREEIYLEYFTKSVRERLSQPTTELSDLNLKIERARGLLAQESAGDKQSTRLLDVEARLRAVRSRYDELSRAAGRLDGMIELEEKQLKKKEEAIERVEDIQVRLGDVEGVANSVEREWKQAESSDDAGHVKGAFWRAKEEIWSFVRQEKTRFGAKRITDADRAELEKLRVERNTVEAELAGVRDEMERAEAEYQSVKRDIDAEKERSRDTERALFEMMTRRSELESTIDKLRNEESELSRAARRFDEELNEAAVLLGRAVLDYSSVALEHEAVLREPREMQETRRREIERGKIRLEDLGAQGGEDVMKEYQETLERDQFLERELTDLAKTKTSLEALIAELNEKLDTEFREGVQRINAQFSEFFRLMFGGGVASLSVVKIEKKKRKPDDLELEDVPDEVPEEHEEDEEGVDINVSLPQKKIRGLQMLSGGERALTSIALLFAISQVNPPPFMVLDETDAALDEANSRKYGDMIENLAKLSQLIVITHNRETMSRAGVLYGITMGADATSKVLSIAFEEGSVYAK
jgi:chromosome segregation protein